MSIQESLAQLRESMPKVREFLAASSERVADPEIKARIAKVIHVFDENFVRVEAELPALFDDLNTRKTTAEAAMKKGLDELAALRESLAVKADEANARLEANKKRLTQMPSAGAADDPELGRKLRQGLLARYVTAPPPKPVDVKSPSFEDWADSFVNLSLPSVAGSSSSAPAPASARGSAPPSSFESWLENDGSGLKRSNGDESLSDEEIRKRRQDVLDYYRRDDK